MTGQQQLLTGWGQTPVPGVQQLGEDLRRISQGVQLSRGLGRSYGDASLPTPGGTVMGSILADRVLAVDWQSGVIRAEAGLSLRELLRITMRRGWFSPVSPGTSRVTLGGMVGADVHGKGHHVAGTFGRHVRSLLLRVADGRLIECNRQHEPELFFATLGGMGLTGHVLEVEFQLRRISSPWIYQRSQRLRNIDELYRALKQDAEEFPYTVSWIDCVTRGSGLGRGLLTSGRWAHGHEAPPQPPKPKPQITVPFRFPNGLLNRVTVWAFNQLYYWKHPWRMKTGIVHYESFWYPLDALLEWHRLYGTDGMTQYQCVLPDEAGPGVARAFVEMVARWGTASPLCVIKDCGAQGEGLLSFPRTGISIALDIPIRAGTQRFIDELNEFVIREGGRIYLAKDGFTRAEDFQTMEQDRLERFLAVRRQWDPEQRIFSHQSQRLGMDRDENGAPA